MSSRLPTVAHGAFIKMLRELRLAKRFEFSDAASVLGINPRTIKRWEDGVNIPSRSSIKNLGQFYGASSAQVEAMCSLAQDAKQPGLTEKFKPGNQPKVWPFAEYEYSAASLWTYESEYIPGLAQTTDYLREIHKAHLDILVPDPQGVRKFRFQRQQRFFSRSQLPEIKVVIGIAAMMYLDALPADVKRGQISRLRQLNDKPTIDIRVITAPHAAMSGKFTIVTPPKDAHGASRFIFLESQDVGRYVEDEYTLYMFDEVFRAVYGRAQALEEFLHD